MNNKDIIEYLLMKNNNSWKVTLLELLHVIELHESALSAYETENRQLKETLIKLESKLLAMQPPSKWWLGNLNVNLNVNVSAAVAPVVPDTEFAGTSTPAPEEATGAATQLSDQDVATTIGTTLNTNSEGYPF